MNILKLMASKRLGGLIISILCIAGGSSAQSIVVHGIPKKVCKTERIDTTYSASKHRVSDLAKDLQISLISKGYLSASVDSLDSSAIYMYCPSDPLLWADIRVSQSSAGYIAESGARIDRWEDDPFSPADVSSLFDKILSHQEEHGYPFSRLRLDSVEVSDNQMHATLHLEPGPYIEVDSIIIRGDLDIPINLIYRSIEIQPHSPFNQERFEAIAQNLKELSFVRLANQPEMVFSQDGNWLYIDLEEQVASSIDAFVGLQSNPSNVDEGTTFFGQFNLELIHLLGVGERINLHWERFQTNSQELTGGLEFPILFKSPFGIAGDLYIFRQDTFFSSFERNISLLYHPNFRSKLEVGYNRFSSQGLGNAESDIENSTGKVEHRTAQVSWRSSSLNDKLNPSKGLFVRTRVNLGEREILESDTTLESILGRAQARVEWFTPLSTSFALLSKVQGGALLSENLLSNEHFRLGGLQTMRGFDQQSIFASEFAIISIEPRLLLDDKSSIFVFAEAGYFDTQISRLRMGWLRAYGAGLNIGNNNSSFNLTWALGQLPNEALNFSSSKIHLGFVSYF